MNITPWPTKQSSPIVTSSQMKAMRLHAGAGADADALLDLGKRSDKAVVADPAAIEVARLDDPDPRAEFDVAHAGLMHLRPVHDTTPSRLSRGVKRSAHFLAGFDRFIECGNQFEALAALETVHQRGALMDQAIDHMLIIGLMTEAIDVGRIDREFLDHVLVGGKFVDKSPVPDLVDGEARDFNRALLAQDRERSLEIGRPRGGRRFDDAERAVAEFQRRDRGVLGLDFRQRGDARAHER